METAATALVYVGLVAAVVGLVNLIRPLRVLRVRRRRTGALVLAAGVALVGIGLALPPRTHHATGATRLDAFFPSWQFAEVHSIRVHATPARVYEAIQGVTADDIWLFRTLVSIRHPGGAWGGQPASILAPPPGEPILHVALRTTFVALADVPGREVVVGTVICCRRPRPEGPEAFAQLQGRALVKAGMNFLIEDEGNGWTRVTTETRVHGSDARMQRRFATYWRFIYPGSALIRRGWLRAIRARAEGAG